VGGGQGLGPVGACIMVGILATNPERAARRGGGVLIAVSGRGGLPRASAIAWHRGMGALALCEGHDWRDESQSALPSLVMSEGRPRTQRINAVRMLRWRGPANPMLWQRPRHPRKEWVLRAVRAAHEGEVARAQPPQFLACTRKPGPGWWVPLNRKGHVGGRVDAQPPRARCGWAVPYSSSVFAPGRKGLGAVAVRREVAHVHANEGSGRRGPAVSRAPLGGVWDCKKVALPPARQGRQPERGATRCTRCGAHGGAGRRGKPAQGGCKHGWHHRVPGWCPARPTDTRLEVTKGRGRRPTWKRRDG
jgi:hypothetical protein